MNRKKLLVKYNPFFSEKSTTSTEGFISGLRMPMILFLATGIGCTGSGVMNLKYAAPVLTFPYVTASGIWTGLVVSYF